MNKHLFAISTYFVTFTLSVLLVGLLTCDAQPEVSAPLAESRTFFVPKVETDEQSSIRTLLTLDEEYGSEYNRGGDNAARAEELVNKMRSLENPNLPVPVRKAYKAHITAWNNLAVHLRKSSEHKVNDRDCRVLSRDISETYNTVLLAASNYGVDF